MFMKNQEIKRYNTVQSIIHVVTLPFPSITFDKNFTFTERRQKREDKNRGKEKNSSQANF